jgi:hypothetical protein
MFDYFNYVNLYNPAMYNDDGVVILEGKISDATTSQLDINECLKLYRTELM